MLGILTNKTTTNKKPIGEVQPARCHGSIPPFKPHQIISKVPLCGLPSQAQKQTLPLLHPSNKGEALQVPRIESGLRWTRTKTSNNFLFLLFFCDFLCLLGKSVTCVRHFSSLSLFLFLIIVRGIESN